MSNFGNVKVKLLNKLTESYTSDNKSEVKEILKQIKSDKNLSEMYLFYEDVENKNISNSETANVFIKQRDRGFPRNQARDDQSSS